MPSDEVTSQAKIDAQVSKDPEKPGSPLVTNDVAPASEPSEAPPAQPESDSLSARLARLESELTTMKRELQTILLDLREKLLEAENPFKTPAAPSQSPANTRRTETRSE